LPTVLAPTGAQVVVPSGSCCPAGEVEEVQPAETIETMAEANATRAAGLF